jgi:hypothetical protein
MRFRILALVAALLGVGVWSASASAAGSTVSSNWAGYAVSAVDPATPLALGSVSGTWVQPAVTCTAGAAAYSAFWVGLGGYSRSSSGLEQVGSEADCSSSGRATYGAWYELVPAAAVPVPLQILPGDTVSASVTVAGTSVSVQIDDVTRGTSFSKQLTMATPDVSSAEWITEAPSTCTSTGRCRTLALANFGTVSFTAASATAAGHTGSITDPAWTPTSVELQSTTAGFFRRSRFAPLAAGAGAVPAALAADGGSFSIAWQPAPARPFPAWGR